jgi:hypothetical protein
MVISCMVGFSGEKTEFYGLANKPSGIAHTQLLHDGPAMRMNRTGRKVELGGNLGIIELLSY